MKILMDSSIIEYETFNLFDKNNILELVRKNKVIFYISDLIFGECIYPNLSFSVEKSRPLIEKLFQYSDERIFAPISDIIYKEVKQVKGKYWFLPLVQSNHLKENVFDKNIYNNVSQYYCELKNKENIQYKFLKQINELNNLFISKSETYSKSDCDNTINKIVHELNITTL